MKKGAPVSHKGLKSGYPKSVERVSGGGQNVNGYPRSNKK
jgi:hypothetical protein